MNDQVIYLSVDMNTQSCASIQEIIDKIDAVILSLCNTALLAASKGHIVEYSIDTGQSKQRVVHSSPKSINDAIDSYMNTRAKYESILTGREFRNVDSRNLRY